MLIEFNSPSFYSMAELHKVCMAAAECDCKLKIMSKKGSTKVGVGKPTAGGQYMGIYQHTVFTIYCVQI